eukprot:TRINITY_DN11584_c0_g1_i4.p1 TRINITY_DN11584_c0_g1~~TRINITY_DN11584_c0_g1_i4.p1  ORF type:complete len:700 (+),score=157.94 TRINITY_DN11584_c0_g1_i4:84-2183(+)
MPDLGSQPKSDADRIRMDLLNRARLRRLFIGKISREGLVFLPLLTMVAFFVWVLHNPSQPIISTSMQRLFESSYGTTIDSTPLLRVSDAEGVYTWLEQVGIPNILSSTTLDSSTGRYYVNSVNILLGGFRFLQKRVPRESCTTKDLFHSDSGPWDCYQPLADGEETSTWTALSDTSWQPYFSCKELGGCIFPETDRLHSPFSEISYTYEGYKIDVGLNETAASTVVASMRAANWIDKQTRLVILQFTTYNAAENVHTGSQIYFEQLAGGLFKSGTQFSSVTIFQKFGDKEDLVRVVEVCIYAQVLATLVFHGYNLVRLGFVGWLKYNGVVSEPNRRGTGSQALFEMFDYINLVIVIVSFGKFIQWISNEEVQALDIQNSATIFVNYVPFVAHRETSTSLWGVNVLVMIFKCFKYLQISNRLNTLWRTLLHSTRELLLFLILMLSLMSGFALTAVVLFGNGHRNWYSYPAAMSSLARILLKQHCAPGDVCIPLAEEYPVIGLVFSVLFTLTVYLVMLAMFLVLMSNAYSVIMDEEFRQILLTEAREPSSGTLDEVASEAWAAFKRKIRLWYSMCLLCDFSELNSQTLPDSLQALADDELSSGEDEKLEELKRMALSPEEREVQETKERMELNAAAEEVAQGHRLAAEEWRFISKHETAHIGAESVVEEEEDQGADAEQSVMIPRPTAAAVLCCVCLGDWW